MGLRGSSALARGAAVGLPCSALQRLLWCHHQHLLRQMRLISIHGSENSGKIRKQGHYKEKVLYVHGAEIRPVGRSVALGRSFSASISLPLPLGGVAGRLKERSSQSDRHRLSDNSQSQFTSCAETQLGNRPSLQNSTCVSCGTCHHPVTKEQMQSGPKCP